MRRSISLGFGLALATLATTAAAHQPYFAGPVNTSALSAFPLSDPWISRVVYADLPCAQRSVWVSVPASAGQDLYLQLGIPALEQLRDFRPSLALVGPDLPDAPADLPFAVPDGEGALIFPTDDVAEPREFYEPFTRTTSWILLDTTVRAPSTGVYRLVGFDPEQRDGRLWIATGTIEQFEPGADIQQVLADVRAFYTPPQDRALGEACAGQPPTDVTLVGGGCTASGAAATHGAASASLLLGAGLLWRRRRQRPRAIAVSRSSRSGS